ncbi:hypothetical protein LVJ85_00070 [Neisseria sp. Dent CA1/247]|uniref:hypothetical protein n=1 Tax=Neisseria sp. Dent CA1/247 TaxID=2912675 RepID=UPI001FD22CCE|nr:hypothetical protein [Neisseria sp. Dent CA1/247]UOO76950.1 hypothetical protein LVJ85_00070 [Neisseria sp. Dent CA1/247]
MDRNFEIAPINASDYVAIPRGRHYVHELNGRVINDWVEEVELVSVEVKGKRPTRHEIMERNKEQFEQIIRKDIMDNIHRDLGASRKEFMPPVGNPPASEAQSTSQPTPPAKPADNPPAATKPSAPQNNGNTADTPPAAKQQNTADKADGAASPSNAANVQKPDHNRSAASKTDVQPEKQTAVTHTNESSENQSEKTPTHPQDQAQNIFGNSVAAAEAGLKNPHKKFLEEADKLKQQLDFKHDLASNLSHQIMQVEEGHIYDERRAYYAQHREAVNEAVEKLRANAAELTEQHGEVKGKLYMMGGLMKMLGGVGHVTDAVELGSLSKTAYETGDWSPVSEKVAKMAASAVAVAGITATARLIGFGLVALGVSGGFVAAGVAIGAGIATYVALDYINKSNFGAISHELSIGNSHSNNGQKEYEYSDLVLIGGSKGYGYPDNIKLSAKNVTMLGKYDAETIEVDAETLLVAGTLKADDVVRLNGTHSEYMEEIRIPEPGSQQNPAPAETAAENPSAEQPPSENNVQEQAQPSAPQAEKPVLPNLADIGTTRISPTSNNAETTEDARKELRAKIGIAADLLSDDELFFDGISEPGGGTLPTVSVTENPVYPDVHQTLPNLPESQENPLI